MAGPGTGLPQPHPAEGYFHRSSGTSRSRQELLRVGARQPLFHVEHSVSGDESRPLNTWRIVHLTDRPEHRLVERFTLIANDVWLPEFIEIYIRSDLNIKLTRRDIS